MNSKKESSLDSNKNDSVHMKKLIWKNIFALTAAFTLNSTAYYGLFSLQSSLHKEDGLGTTALGLNYLMNTFACLFLPALLIGLIGHKWTIILSFISYMLWIITNGIGTWAAMIPASILNGLLDSSLWTSQGSYITELSKIYATYSGDVPDRVCTMFFGVFGISFGMAGLISDTIASTVLEASPPENYTKPSEDDVQEYCGINDCPWNVYNTTDLNDPPSNVVWTLVSIYLIFSLCAITIVIIFLEPLHKLTNKKEQKSIKDNICNTLLSAISLLKHYRMWLLLVINCFYSASAAFKNAEFNYSWVTCGLGIWMIGFINIPGYIVGIPTIVLTGIVSNKIGRIIPMVCSLLLNICSISILFFWDISSSDVWVYYMLSVLFCLHSYMLDPVVNAVHGMSFYNQTTAIFASYNFFWSLFSAIFYSYSYYLCTDTKLYIVLGLLVAGFTSYFILEWDLKTRPPENNPNEYELDTTLEIGSHSDNKLNEGIYQEQTYTKF